MENTMSNGKKVNDRKYRQQYSSGTSLGNSNFRSGGRLSLSSIENLEMWSLMPSPMYGPPVKVDGEVVVMDDIQMRPSGGSSSSSSSKRSGNCCYNSKCHQYAAHGREELLLNRLTLKSKSEAQTGKLSTRPGPGPGPYTYGPNSHIVDLHLAAAESEVAVIKSQPASPESHHHTLANFKYTTNDWSPFCPPKWFR